MEPIYRNCPHLLEYADARTQAGAFINDGTCAYSLALSGGAVVSSGPMPFVTGKPGLYRAQIPAADLAGLTIGAVYVATITFTAPGNLGDERAVSYRAAVRGAN